MFLLAGRLLKILILLGLGFRTLSAWSGQEYLLTGVIASSDGGRSFAVIEQADGRQNLVGEGDSIGDGRVEMIDSSEKIVRLVFPDGKVVLKLSGSAYPEEYVEEFNIQDYAQETPVMSTLDDSAIKGLLDLSREASKLNAEVLSARLTALLGLTPDATITAFNEEQIDSTAQLLERLAPLLVGRETRGNFLGTIAVADESGRRRIYLNTSSP